MSALDGDTFPHRRLNPLTGDYVLVSPQRGERPWQGQTEPVSARRAPSYDPACYLCPGNGRAGGGRNPRYDGTFVFDNDFSAILPVLPPSPGQAGVGGLEASAASASARDSALFNAEPVVGLCRVICFSPRHDLTLPDMTTPEVARVVETWAAETASLGSRYRWVQLFENKGAVMGCSNPHPHGQIWASSSVPNEAAAEDRHQRNYFEVRGTPLLCEYAARELQAEIRLVHESQHFMAVVPFWASWPFETLLVPKRHVARLPDLTASERLDLAAFLRALLGTYDRLFDVSFPYSMGWHGAPFDGGPGAPHWQLHAHFYPPLLRSSTVKKFMVGYEMLAEPQRDLTPEQAARRLRERAKL